MKRRVLIAVAAGLVSVASGALSPPARASSPEHFPTLMSKPVEVHGYRLTFSVSKYHPRTPATLDVKLLRVADGATEEDSYRFTTGVSFKVRKDLSSAKISADLGRFGEVALRFRQSRSREGPGRSDPCGRKLTKSRRGVLRGTFKLRTRSRFFGTVRKRSVAATLGLVPRVPCARSKVPAGDFWLSNTVPGGGPVQFSAARLSSGTVEERFWLGGQSSPWDALVTHTIIARAHRSAFTVSPDLSSARVDGIAPFLAGSVKFAATEPTVGNGRLGTLSGNLRANFDSIGTVELISASSVSAILRDCRAGCVAAVP